MFVLVVDVVVVLDGGGGVVIFLPPVPIFVFPTSFCRRI
jgi:hypothetical protein